MMMIGSTESVYFFGIPRILVPEALRALFIDYFVCHDRSIKLL